MKEDNNWKYENRALYPVISLDSDYVESGQLETFYTHVTQVEANEYRLVTNWVCDYLGKTSLITAILYRRDKGIPEKLYHHVLLRKEIEIVGQQARQYAVKKHSKLVALHLMM